MISSQIDAAEWKARYMLATSGFSPDHVERIAAATSTMMKTAHDMAVATRMSMAESLEAMDQALHVALRKV